MTDRLFLLFHGAPGAGKKPCCTMLGRLRPTSLIARHKWDESRQGHIRRLPRDCVRTREAVELLCPYQSCGHIRGGPKQQ